MIVCLVALVALAGCGGATGQEAADRTGPPPSWSWQDSGPPPDGSRPPDRPGGPEVELTRASPDSPSATTTDVYRTRYGWAVPAAPVVVGHEVRPPVARWPQPPLPYLVEIDAAAHPAAVPAFSRVTFAFRSGFPSYEVGYVPTVVLDGSGDPLDLPGNCYLQVRFVTAQAHDEQGRMSVRRSPRPELDLGSLRGYGFAGDFEGRVTYGLGIQAGGDSDQVPAVRIAERTRDGLYVVAVDVAHG
ncbi:hypothetical protein O7623_02020 [Solwaraspora sp. WMMD791]|uniref:AMIN-like domain-containing (lipo)protein n=1 Tax=Solwaraspora sp. WMMD791 TaxID=3016086 RepID=UPI00249A7267|nr:hypothetical protein [Solwaraspora sp. WMMD791]WFE28007.1 hypothetical protein O7623_02020 [Solwaraspora sp. WMMD791]